MFFNKSSYWNIERLLEYKLRFSFNYILSKPQQNIHAMGMGKKAIEKIYRSIHLKCGEIL